MKNNELFDLFLSKKSNSDLFNSIELLIERTVFYALKVENRKFYENVLNPLMNSINNAGWEKRHSQQIDLINKASHDILEKYDYE